MFSLLAYERDNHKHLRVVESRTKKRIFPLTNFCLNRIRQMQFILERYMYRTYMSLPLSYTTMSKQITCKIRSDPGPRGKTYWNNKEFQYAKGQIVSFIFQSINRSVPGSLRKLIEKSLTVNILNELHVISNRWWGMSNVDRYLVLWLWKSCLVLSGCRLFLCKRESKEWSNNWLQWIFFETSHTCSQTFYLYTVLGRWYAKQSRRYRPGIEPMTFRSTQARSHIQLF